MRANRAVMAVLLAMALVAFGFDLGARAAKFSPANEVEFSGHVVGGPAAKDWRM